MEEGDNAQHLRPRPLIARIDAKVLQGSLLQRSACTGLQTGQYVATTSTVTAAGTAGGLHRRTAPDGQQTTKQSTSDRLLIANLGPKPFRAGFAYERQQTPEHTVRKRQQQEQQRAQQQHQQRSVSASPPRGVLKHTTANHAADGTIPAVAASAGEVPATSAVPAAATAGAEASNVPGPESNKLHKARVQWDGNGSNSDDSSTACTSSKAEPILSCQQTTRPLACSKPLTTCSTADCTTNSSSIPNSSPAAVSSVSRPTTRSGLQRSSSYGRLGTAGSAVAKSAVIGGAALLQGHLNGQTMDVLQSLVAESLDMLSVTDPQSAAADSIHCCNEDNNAAILSHYSASPNISYYGTKSGAGSGYGTKSHRITAAAVTAGAAAAAAVSLSRGGGRKLARDVSLADEHEEEEAALAAMLMMLPCIEPPAIQAAPEQFSLPLVAAALGQSVQQLAQQQQTVQQQQQRPVFPTGNDYDGYNSNRNDNSISTACPQWPIPSSIFASPTNVNCKNNNSTTVSNASSALTPTNKINGRVSSPERLGPSSLSPSSAVAQPVAAQTSAIDAMSRLPLTAAQNSSGLELQLRALSAAPALAQQYTRAQLLLAQTFGADLQQPPAAAAATVAAEAARAAGTAAAVAGNGTGRSRPVTGAKSARRSTAAAGDGSSKAHGSSGSSSVTAGSTGTAVTPAAAGLTSSPANSSSVIAARQSPVRTRVLAASLEQQQKRQQQRQQRLLSSSCDFAASSSSSTASAANLRSSWHPGVHVQVSSMDAAAGSANNSFSKMWATGASGSAAACNIQPCSSSSSSMLQGLPDHTSPRSTHGCAKAECITGVGGVLANRMMLNRLNLQGQCTRTAAAAAVVPHSTDPWDRDVCDLEVEEDDCNIFCNTGANSHNGSCNNSSSSQSGSAAAVGTCAVDDSTEQQQQQHSSSGGKGRSCRFQFETYLKQLGDRWQQPTADQVDAEVALSAPTAAAVSLNFAWGDVGRLIKRYHQQPGLYPAAFNLSNAITGRQQIAALAQAIPQMPSLTALLLRNNDIDDRALQTLASALLQPECSTVSCLDLSHNRLSSSAPTILLPLLHRPPRKTAAAAAAGEVDRASACGRRASCDSSGQLVLSNGPNGAGHAMLTQLVLAGNPIGDAGAEVVCQLVATGDSLLQLLDMSRCGITEKTAGCLKGLLEGARQLQVLWMGWNNLGPKGGKALAEGLRYCSTLQQLLLPWSGISDLGASHIAKALESNSSVRLLDLSGCQVSAATCIVLVETLSVNKELELLILQGNPLGAAGAQKLLRAVHAGKVKHVDLAGCCFLNPAHIAAHNPAQAASSPAPGQLAAAGPAGGAAAVFDAREPDGSYTLDLASPADRQVAVELLKLAADHGLDSWVDPRLNKKPYSISGVTKQQLPSSGILTVTFVAKHKPSWEATPLTDAEFGSMWTMLVDPARLSTAAAVLEQELNVMDFGYGVKRSSGLWAGGVGHQGLLQQQQQQQQAGDSVFVTQSAGVLARDWEVPTSRADSPPAAAAVFAAKSGAQPARGSFLPSSHAGQQDCTGSKCSGPRLNSSCSQYCGIAARGSCFGGLEYGSIAGSALAGISSSSSPGGDVGAGVHLHAVTDGWKMELLQVLAQECYFTSKQAGQMVAAFSYGEDKVDAAVKVFGRVVDPEKFVSEVYATLNSWQVELADARIGCLKLFSPDNPTGKYSLLLSHPAQRLVAVRLLELFCQQHTEGYCAFPHSICFTSAVLDEQPLPAEQLADPTRITLPRSGLFKVCFVDLKPIPQEAKPLSPEGFAVLVGVLVASRHLDATAMAEAVDDVDVAAKVKFVGRFDTWNTSHGPFTGKVSALRRLAQGPGPVVVKDLGHFVEAIHVFAIHHHITGSQLIELVKLLPESASNERVELCSCFWARLTDRAKTWSDVMRALGREEQVALAQRLGYANVFDAVRPAMHYRLRMWRADDHQIAWRLHRMALTSQQQCFKDFSIDGVVKRVKENVNLWSVMRGSAGERDTPTVTLDFDFDWEDAQLPHWAAVTIQAAWRAYKSRKVNPTPAAALTWRSRCSTASGVRAVSRLGARPSMAGGTGLFTSSGSTASIAGALFANSRMSALNMPSFGGMQNSSIAGYTSRSKLSPSKHPAGDKPEWDVQISRFGVDAASHRGEYESSSSNRLLLSRMGRNAAAVTGSMVGSIGTGAGMLAAKRVQVAEGVAVQRPDSAGSALTYASLGMSSVSAG